MGHAHTPDSLDRVDRHLSDSFVDADWRRTKADRAICTVVDRNPIDQHRFLWPPGRPVLTVTYRVPNKRIDGNRKLFDQNSVLAHGESNPGRH
jgi:hypothetical protein